jgi:hypothetical protein
MFMASFLDVFIKADLSIDKLSAFAIPAFRIIYHSMAEVAGRFSRSDRFHVLQKCGLKALSKLYAAK